MKRISKVVFGLVAVTLSAKAALAEPHKEVGVSMQDEAIANALDDGITQESYLTMFYGTNSQAMLDAAFDARAEYFVETGAVLKHLANGDIRNITCGEYGAKRPKQAFLRIAQRMKSSFFSPNEKIPCGGRMFGITNAFDYLVETMRTKTGKEIRFKGAPSLFKNTYDANGTSYAFWPLGVAIHDNGGYAEEVAHFFNSMPPLDKPMVCKGTWSSPDYQKVTVWNEFIAALHGVKVHAYANGINLNIYNVTTREETDGDGNTTTVEVPDTPQFDIYYALVSPQIEGWVSSGIFPISQNAFVLLMAYREALSHEGKETDNAAYKRFREMCRNHKIAQMVL